MTDLVNPSPNRTVDARLTATAIYRSAHSTHIVENTDPGGLYAGTYGLTDVSGNFAPSWSSSSTVVTVDPGEAFVEGAYLARDTQTSVDLGANRTDAEVAVGWDESAPNEVIVAEPANFPSGGHAHVIGTFTTDGTGVTAGSDDRTLGRSLDIQNAYYDDGGNGAKVDHARDADALGGRGLNGVARDAVTLSMPAGRIPASDEATLFEWLPSGQTLKLLAARIGREDGTLPAGVSLEVRDAAGTVLDSYASRVNDGTVGTPLLSVTGEQYPLTFAWVNGTGSTDVFGGRVTYLIE